MAQEEFNIIFITVSPSVVNGKRASLLSYYYAKTLKTAECFKNAKKSVLFVDGTLNVDDTKNKIEEKIQKLYPGIVIYFTPDSYVGGDTGVYSTFTPLGSVYKPRTPLKSSIFFDPNDLYN